MSVTATVVGDVQVKAHLLAAGSVASGRNAELALVAGALLIQNAAKGYAPWKSGTLRRSIHIGGHTFGSDGDVDGASDIGMNNEQQVAVGTNLPYARRIEKGFSGTDSLGRTYNQPPRSYLRKALDEQRDAAIREIADAYRDLLRSAAT